MSPFVSDDLSCCLAYASGYNHSGTSAKTRLTIHCRRLKMPIHNRNNRQRSPIVNLRRIAGFVSPLIIALVVSSVVPESRGAWPFSKDRPSASGKSSYRDVSTERPVAPGMQADQSVAPAARFPAPSPQAIKPTPRSLRKKPPRETLPSRLQPRTAIQRRTKPKGRRQKDHVEGFDKEARPQRR